MPIYDIEYFKAKLAAADARIASLETDIKTVAQAGDEQFHRAKIADARIAVLEALLRDQHKLTQAIERRAETAETLLEEARRALGPFIRLADNVFSDGKNATVADEVTLWCFNDTDITFGDLRRARATLDRIGK